MLAAVAGRASGVSTSCGGGSVGELARVLRVPVSAFGLEDMGRCSSSGESRISEMLLVRPD
eukprot:1339030-Prymnesium_polylepis.1